MGQKLYENNIVFRNSLDQSEIIVQKYLNRSLVDELYFNPDRDFDDLLITHPSIVAIEIAMYEVLNSMNITPDYVYGNSLGEFSAGVVCGIWDARTALEASIEQAKSMVRSCNQGGMIVVINHVKKNLKKGYLAHGLYLAANNFKGHFTLSGSVKNLNAYQLELCEFGVQYLRLQVSIPFHSPLVGEALKDFSNYMGHIHLRKPNPGFISGLEYVELDMLPFDYFGEVVGRYVDYPKIVSYIETKGPCFYIDLGPSGTMSTFVKYNLDSTSNSRTIQIMTPFKTELKQLEKLKNLVS
jgi:bacillaene synthase trans-acting acyltransferase